MDAGGGAVRRLDGDRYVRGRVRYLDDEQPEGCLHLVFVRSVHAHASIREVRADAALAEPGVRAVLSGVTASGLVGDLVCLLPEDLTGAAGPLTLPCLPVQRIRYAGEPVALVVADTEEAARRGAALVVVDAEPLPPLLDVEAATAPGAPAQHPALPGNVVMSGVVSEGDEATVLAAAPNVVEGEVALGRGSAVPLEPRGCIARVDDEGRLVVRAATQQPHGLRADLARQLGLPESDIRVVAPPLGGGFGFKFPGLPEEPLTCLMALRLHRPVRWVETRAEALLIGARDYRARYRAGYDPTGRVLALSVDLDADIGALCATPGPVMPAVAAATFPSGYDVTDLEVRWRAVMTNKGPWNGARGFGKEATCLVTESVMDHVAAATGLDPVEVRRRNLLRGEQLPRRTSTMTIDSGDYHRALDMVLDLAHYDDLRARQSSSTAGTERLGIGVGFELTPEGIDYAGSLSRGFETATVRLDTSGHATVLTGVTSPGTGSETAIAQLVAGALGLPVSSVRVVQGDTDRTPFGSGSFSSRAVMTGGTAAWLAARDLRAGLDRSAAALLGADVQTIRAADGLFRVDDDSGRAIPVGPLIAGVRTLGDALPGVEGLQLESTRTYGPQNLQSIPDQDGRLQQYPTYSYSVHVAAVLVDVETGSVRIERLAAVHDCGTVINQKLVDAQLHGAVAMGVGIALYEEEGFDPDGTPTSSDFKRYLLPRHPDIPRIASAHLVSPSPFTELGTKGAGEGGVGGSAAAIAGAVRDALGAAGHPTRTPLTPARVLAVLDGVTDLSALLEVAP
ncbi:xanthine dehydrogenase family protein molybdopterin-binding subunit [Actinomycetospora chiangmaiensis]|uniref:xanthine dehydrogenase family protein molybdopterin-binding subunit n=1 Tax=Actinomycetospora chiangmaiensis TaxID=402650 RepID=UPI00039F2743|nr:xanthine dehydrogenase family protein molybdopterin-binding subunit [Actinomycetospora chiangmaiensis]